MSQVRVAATTRSRIRCWAGFAALAMGLGFVLSAPAAQAATVKAPAPPPPSQPRVHYYPTVSAARAARAAASPNPSNLPYKGGHVMTGKPVVYLVFWGSQWGTGSAQTGFSADPSHVAPQLVKVYQGLGARVPDNDPNTADPYEQYTNTTKWYCQGAAVGTDGLNSQTGCSAQSAANHVGYPTDGALAGIYNDTATAEPTNATQANLAAEADRAAAHFGDVRANAQYVIASAHGTHPDGFFTPGGFCAYHSYSYLAAHPVAYTNMPYAPDAGAQCGAGFVNGTSGPLDGVSILAGHEYSETVTDPFIDAWVDYGPNGTQVIENGDKCAWIQGSSNTQANAQNVKLKTGTFPFQSNWMNSADYNGLTGSCRISTK